MAIHALATGPNKSRNLSILPVIFLAATTAASESGPPRLVALWGLLRADPPHQRTAVGVLNLTTGAIAWSAPFEIPNSLSSR